VVFAIRPCHLLADMPARLLTPEQLGHVAERFKALAEPSRLQILASLREGERTVSQILEATGHGQANASKHLQILHAAGFVARRRDGVNTWYRLADEDVFKLCDLVCGRIERELKARGKLFAG
jgi:DNA-binding transcriptional ArsR family regulator